MTWLAAALLGLVLLAPDAALAAQPLDGAAMRWPWALPFAGILLSIATGPLLFPRIWHHHYGKIALGWSVLTIAPLGAAVCRNPVVDRDRAATVPAHLA
jgi:uncharacterized membrane protein YhaH (DUF805 family)